MKTAEKTRFDRRFDVLFGIDPEQIIAEGSRHQYGIDDVEKGGVIRISGEVFVVGSVSKYVETNDKYTKDKSYTATEFTLFSLKTGETRYIEYSIDDELEVYFTERKLTLAELNRELRDDEGKSFNVDDDVDECVEEGWSVILHGVEYPYADDWACRFETSGGRRQNAYMYEFGDDNVGHLTIEGWKEGGEWDYEGYLSQRIMPESIEIISLGRVVN